MALIPCIPPVLDAISDNSQHTQTLFDALHKHHGRRPALNSVRVQIRFG